MPITLDDIQQWLPQLRTSAGLDWCAYECLANDPTYTKPDAEKQFILWEAEEKERGTFEVQMIDGLKDDHPWLYAFFLPEPTQEGHLRVRFPFNSGDSELFSSLSPNLVDSTRVNVKLDAFWKMRRWSTASRSSLALVPNGDPQPLQDPKWEDQRSPTVNINQACVNQDEWADPARDTNRFYTVIGPDLGEFTSADGHQANGDNVASRLYSIKTGVSYVGSKFEAPAGKNRLEVNSALAITRSTIIKRVEALRKPDENNFVDDTFRTQLELLTVTAPIVDSDDYDGFQVRDLSCMRDGEVYLPGLCVPYSEKVFSQSDDVQTDFEFWVANFARPVGRAKAKLFLEYGLIHESANAQNFLLVFDQNKLTRLKAIILRDIGDTYWHNGYVEGTLGNQYPSVYQDNKGGILVAEKKSRHYLLLHENSGGSYPPPHLVRIAAHSVITHGFDDALVKLRTWTEQQVLQLAQGLLDGYKDFFSTTLAKFHPQDPNFSYASQGDMDVSADLVEEIGKKFSYPRGAYTWQEAKAFQEKYKGKELMLAASIRKQSAALLDAADDKAKMIQWLINAEEMALCSAFERYLPMQQKPILPRVVG
jgi:hypothetical protein